jgi:hypothetical protein
MVRSYQGKRSSKKWKLERKIELKGLHFADVAEIQEAVTDELKEV